MKIRVEVIGFLLIFSLSILNCSITEAGINSSLQYKNPQKVNIDGIPDGAEGLPLSIEEPFISRDDISEPSGAPEIIDAIGTSDFIEGPAISADEKELYYHRREGKKNQLYKVCR